MKQYMKLLFYQFSTDMHMNDYNGSALQIIKFMPLLGDEGLPVQVDGEAWVQPPGMIRIIHKNRMQMLCRNRVSAYFVRMLFRGLYKRPSFLIN